jgi:hypothetical protein
VAQDEPQVSVGGHAGQAVLDTILKKRLSVEKTCSKRGNSEKLGSKRTVKPHLVENQEDQ